MRIKVAVCGLAHGHVYCIIEDLLKVDGITFNGVYDDNSQYTCFASEKYNVRGYESLDQLIENEKVDLIVTAAVNNKKVDIIEKAFENGISVVADKPLVTSLEDLELVKNAYEKAKSRYGNIFLYMYLSRRFAANVNKAKQLIDQGAIGEIVEFVAFRPHRLAPQGRPDWMFEREKYGGIIVDLAVHDIDVFRWLGGSEISEILVANHRNAYFKQFKDFEDFGEVFLRFENGSTAFTRADWLTSRKCPWHGDCRTIILGTKGQIEINDSEEWLKVFSDDMELQKIVPESVTVSFEDDIVKSMTDPYYKPIITSEDVFEVTEITLKARDMADRVYYK